MKKNNKILDGTLIRTLISGLKHGSIKKIEYALKHNVNIKYVDRKRRNLIMIAIKNDTIRRLQAIVLLSDAGCDINHIDILGWSCIHYACAYGAFDIFSELLRREVKLFFNKQCYIPEDFQITKIKKVSTLYQHTNQKTHELNVKKCWEILQSKANKVGYSLHIIDETNENFDETTKKKKMIKVSYKAPKGHHIKDRIRLIDINSNVPPWKQTFKIFNISQENEGVIEIPFNKLKNKKCYRLVYEKYGQVDDSLKHSIINNNFIKNFDEMSFLSESDGSSLDSSYLSDLDENDSPYKSFDDIVQNTIQEILNNVINCIEKKESYDQNTSVNFHSKEIKMNHMIRTDNKDNELIIKNIATGEYIPAHLINSKIESCKEEYLTSTISPHKEINEKEGAIVERYPSTEIQTRNHSFSHSKSKQPLKSFSSSLIRLASSFSKQDSQRTFSTINTTIGSISQTNLNHNHFQNKKTEKVKSEIDSSLCSNSYVIAYMTDALMFSDNKIRLSNDPNPIKENIRKPTNEYEVTINQRGPIGIVLEAIYEKSYCHIMVLDNKNNSFIRKGDFLIGINNNNDIGYFGFQHTIWSINEKPRPIILRFKKNKNYKKRKNKSLYQKVLNISLIKNKKISAEV